MIAQKTSTPVTAWSCAADLPARREEREVGDREHRRERDRGLDRGRPLAGRVRLELRADPLVPLTAAGVAAAHRRRRARRSPAAAYGCAAPTGASSSAARSARAAASGSAASVIARTTTIRRAPRATTARRGGRVEAADREPRRVDDVLGGPAHVFRTRGGAAGLRRRRMHRARGEVVDVRVGVGRRALRRCVRRAADDRVRAGDRARRGGRAVVLADVDAVRAARGDEVGPVVEDEERTVRVGGGPELPRGDDQLVVAERLVAQLHDVRAAPQRGLQEGPRARVADQVQTGCGEALAGAHRAQ